MRRSIHTKSRPVFVGLVLVLSSTACGGVGVPNPFSGGPEPETSFPEPEASPGEVWSPDEVLRAEIRERGKNDQTAMQLIRRLRPAWLRARGQKSLTDRSSTYPVVYIDEIRHGGLQTLNHIPVSEIRSMQFFSMADATTRWGTGHPSGVINIVTGR